MSVASWFLFVPVCLVVAFDVAVFRRSARKLLWLEVCAFIVGGTFILWPSLSTQLAAAVGIGRGADLIMYLSVLWLLRESLLSRYHRLTEAERVTELARAVAMQGAINIESRQDS